MKTKDIDAVIRKALEKENSDMIDSLEEPKISDQVTSLFQGRWRYINAMSMVVVLLLFALAIFCATKFFGGTDVLSAMRWGAGMFFCWMGVAYLKLWAGLELERHAVTREIKRLELQVAHLATRIRTGE